MECRKCGSTKVLTEALGEGKVRVVCQECSNSEVRDQQGRRMLTDDMPRPGGREYLTS